MDANLYNLLTSKWHITENTMNAMIPSLVRLLKGKPPISVKSERPRYFSISNGILNEVSETSNETPAATNEKLVAVMPIHGVIVKHSQLCGPMGTREMKSIMEEWKTDDRIASVLFHVDSGGGEHSGTMEFGDYVHNYPKKTITFVDGEMASAAYFIGSATDEVWANPFAEGIGSIGTMAKGLNLDGVVRKKGGEIIEEYATKSTKKNHVWRELKKGNVKPLIEDVLDPSNEKFIQTIQEYRPNLNPEVLNGIDYADPEIALEKGLIDFIGTYEEVMERAFSISEETPEPEPVNSNSNLNTDMSKENSFPKLAAVLGVENVEAKKPHMFAANETVSLNVDQLQSIEAALTAPGDGQKLTDLQTSLDAANAAKTKAEGEKTAIENAIDTALDTTGLTTEKKATAVENITLMSEKLVEYGAKDGDEPTQVKAKADPVQTTPETTHIFDSLIN